MSRDSFLHYLGDGRIVTPPSAVLIPTTAALPVPLYAVSSISLAQSYHMPPVGASGARAAIDSHDDTISISAILPGAERYGFKLALETLAEASLGSGLLGGLGIASPAPMGIILWTPMTLRTDMYIQSLSFSASASKRAALDVSITLVHLPRPGLGGEWLDLGNAVVSTALDATGVIG
jgi:hypothetical protein